MKHSDSASKVPVFYARAYLLLFLFLIVYSASSCAQQGAADGRVYSIKADLLGDDSAKLVNFSVKKASQTAFPMVDTGYEVSVLSSYGQSLFKGNIGSSSHVDLRVPYYEEGTAIRLTHQGRTVLYIDLIKELCKNNGFCDPYCAPDVDPDCSANAGAKILDYLIYFPSLILLLTVSFVFYRKRQYDKNAKEVKDLLRVRVEGERVGRGASENVLK